MPRIYDPACGFVATANEDISLSGGPRLVTLPVRISITLTRSEALWLTSNRLPSGERATCSGSSDEVIGAEPEPALNGEKQFLRWRFLKDKQPFGDLEEMTATVKRNGKTFGPFTGRMAAREPGVRVEALSLEDLFIEVTQ